ncbi:MAG: purine-binding chemotaxis protein CheW [Candidatus Riflebacteria bacterium]|nr:purine-binding chemotaxis protein CheW [Candidatus Riflebacteria bacterium]
MKNTKKTSARQEIQVVGFYIGTDEYALGISDVREIVAMTDIRKVPKAPKFVEGVINLRGKIVPILDLRKRFDITPAAEMSQAKILIIEFHSNLLGMIVDNVSEVFKLSSDQLERTPPILGSAIDSQYIWGVGKVENRLVILLDTEKLLSFEEKNQLASMRP